MDGLDAMATGIMRFEGFEPGTPAFKNVNPGNLRTPDWAEHDSGGFDVYPSFIAGFAALSKDIRDKFDGHNEHGLGPDSTLLQLMEVYAPAADGNLPMNYASFLAEWVSAALGKTITVESPLKDIWTPPV